MSSRPGRAGDLDRVAAGGGLAVGEQHDRRGRPLRPRARRPAVERRGQRVAGGRAAVGGQAVDQLRDLARGRRVGGSTVCGSVEKATTPTRASSGTSSRKRCAAERAASRRLGSTSSASIERDTSVTSTIDACSRGHGDGGVRAGERERERGERGQEQRQRRLAPPGRHARQQRRERGDAREAHGVAPRAPARRAAGGRARAARAASAARKAGEAKLTPASGPSSRAHAPVGRQHHVLGARRAAARAATAARSSAAAAAKRSRRRRLEVSTSTRCPVSGSTSASRPTVGQRRARAGRGSRPPAPCGARASAASGRAQSGGPAKSEITHHQAAQPRQPAEPRQRRGRAASPSAPSGATPSASARRRPTRAPRPPRGGSSRVCGAAVGQQRHAPAAAHGERAQHVDHALGHVALEPVGGAERHRRRRRPAPARW